MSSEKAEKRAHKEELLEMSLMKGKKRKICVNLNCGSNLFYITDKLVSADNYGGKMEIDAVLCVSCGMDQDIGDYI